MWSMSTRYDLEQAIMAIWSTCDDLKLFAEEYYDGKQIMTIDETFGHIDGIRGMLELRCRKAFDCYKRHEELDEYCTDPVKLKEREKLLGLLDPKKKGKKK